MRPDPRHQQDRSPDGRIIYLGDVRRRRRARRTAPDRHYLAALTLVAIAAWAAWLAVFVSLAPSRLLTYIAFFAPLAVALAATGTLAAYVGLARTRDAGMVRAGRLGTLGAGVIVANLAFVASHRWTPVAAIVSVGLAVGIDVLVSRRAWPSTRPRPDARA